MDGDVLDALEQLGYEGPLLEEQALLKAAEGGLSSPEYVELCGWLSSRLKVLCDLEENFTPASGDPEKLQTALSALLTELHCPHDVSKLLKGSPQDHLKFVLFLSSELQAAQITKVRHTLEKQRERSLECQELTEICQSLSLSEGGGCQASELFSTIHSKVDKLLEDVPKGWVGNPVLRKTLSAEQWDKLKHINTALSSEYECRRRMLIKRLDVTVQSFGWSERAKVRVDSMAAAYQPRRHALRPQTSVDAAKLLAAREDLCNLLKTSSGASRHNTSCAVNKVQMGRVPDRGGRPDELHAPPPEMPAWKARQEGGGGWGGRGGGRGGGGGGGGYRGWGQGGGGGGGGGERGWGQRGGGGGKGGGGWRAGGWNHGGKRGRYQY